MLCARTHSCLNSGEKKDGRAPSSQSGKYRALARICELVGLINLYSLAWTCKIVGFCFYQQLELRQAKRITVILIANKMANSELS